MKNVLFLLLFPMIIQGMAGTKHKLEDLPESTAKRPAATLDHQWEFIDWRAAMINKTIKIKAKLPLENAENLLTSNNHADVDMPKLFKHLINLQKALPSIPFNRFLDRMYTAHHIAQKDVPSYDSFGKPYTYAPCIANQRFYCLTQLAKFYNEQELAQQLEQVFTHKNNMLTSQPKEYTYNSVEAMINNPQDKAMIALEHNCPELIDIEQTPPLSLDILYQPQQSALSKAASCLAYKSVQFLLEHGMNPDNASNLWLGFNFTHQVTILCAACNAGSNAAEAGNLHAIKNTKRIIDLLAYHKANFSPTRFAYSKHKEIQDYICQKRAEIAAAAQQ